MGRLEPGNVPAPGGDGLYMSGGVACKMNWQTICWDVKRQEAVNGCCQGWEQIG